MRHECGMETGLVERAFQLAASCSSIEEIRSKLRREGYANVDAYLQGPSIRAELKKLLNRQPTG
jgi:hypothetical protein